MLAGDDVFPLKSWLKVMYPLLISASLDTFCLVITANMQSETGFPSSHQLKSYVASKSRLKLAPRAVLSADAGLLVQSFVATGIALSRQLSGWELTC